MAQFFSQAVTPEGVTRSALRLRYVLVTFLALAMLGAVAVVFADINRQLDQIRASDSENVTWTYAQAEVDLLKLQHAVHKSIDAPPSAQSLRQVRLSFDIFYSRMLVLQRLDSEMPAAPSANLLAKVWAKDGFFARYTPVMDGDDADLTQALPGLHAELESLAEEVRATVVTSLHQVMAATDQTRAGLRQSLQFFGAAALAVLGLMLALLAVIVVQYRALYRRAGQTARAVHNLRATIESSLDAVVIADLDGQVIDCNSAAEGLFDLARPLVRRRNLKDLLHSDRWGDPFAELRLKPADRDPAVDLRDGRRLMQGQRRDGRLFPVEMAMAEARGASGEPMVIVFLRDISERVEREKSLQDARNDALKGEEAKSRFLAVMSHEMRTPLNGLIAATELLQGSTALDDRQAWLSDIILSCGWAALDQVNNVLELTRLGLASGPSYPLAVFSPADVLRELVAQNEPQAAKRGNRLDLSLPDAPLPKVEAPRQLMMRVLYNLIGNAIKFTEAGRILIRLTAEMQAEGKLHLVIAVEDTGIGIAEADLDRIFHNFQTLDDSYARMQEGTGLGLGIAKLSAEALGGEIRVKSTLGKGSIFTLDVLLNVAQADDSLPVGEDAEPKGEAALSILVAEDNPINSLLLAEMLKLRGHEVTIAPDGQAAVQHALARPFDLILMDVAMPRMDGLEATRRIRAAGPCQRVPIIGVTANASPDRIPDFRAAGMTEIVVKPIARRVLAAMLARYGKAAGSGSGGPGPDEPLPAKESAMLNEDVFVEMLQEMGRDFMERVTARMLVEAQVAVADIRSQAGHALPRAGQTAHKAAGAAAAIGLAGLHAAFAACEQAAEVGDLAAALAAAQAAEAAIPATRAALRQHGRLTGGGDLAG